MIGPTKELFIELYKSTGTYDQYMAKLHDYPEYHMSKRTFQSRVREWIYDGKPRPTAKDTQPDDRPIAAGVIEAPDKRRRSLQGKRFVFTSAQNNTYVHEEFLKSLLVSVNIMMHS
jgi:hypothetical protein